MVQKEKTTTQVANSAGTPIHAASDAALAKLAERIAAHAAGDLLFVSDLADNARKALQEKAAKDGDAVGLTDAAVDAWIARELVPDTLVAPVASKAGYSNRWASYVNRKFTEEWYSPDKVTKWRLMTRMLALIVEQEEAQPLRRIAVAAGDHDFGCDRSIALLRKMTTYLKATSPQRGARESDVDAPATAGGHDVEIAQSGKDGKASTIGANADDLTGDATIEFKHAALRRWLQTSVAFRNYVAPHVGNRLWADYAKLLVRSGFLLRGGITFLFKYGLNHLEAAAEREHPDAADHTGDAVSLEPLQALIEVNGALGVALEKVWILDDAHQFKLQLPRRYAKAFRLIERFRKIMPQLTPRALFAHTDALLTMVRYGADEIPALYPPLRILAENGWRGPDISWRTLLDQIVFNDQLVARVAVARANADAYHDGNDITRALIREIVEEWATQVDQASEQAHSDADLNDEHVDRLDVVAYFFKFLWSRCFTATPDKWLDAAFERRAAEFGNHPFASIRMAFGESLIECCCDCTVRLDATSSDPWHLGRLGYRGLFYRPIWDYHCIDLAEAFGAWMHRSAKDDELTATGPELCLDRIVVLGNKTRERLRRVQRSLAELKSSGSTAAAPMPRELASAIDAYWQTEEVLRELESIQITSETFVDGDAADVADRVSRWFMPFACHPTWEVTEAVASKLAEWREFEHKLGRRTNIADVVIGRWGKPATADEIANDCWQLRYAACDAAFNSMDVDEHISHQESLFIQLVDANYNHREFSRVQFICAEDTFLWFAKLKDARMDAALSADIAHAERDLIRWATITAKWLRYWFAHANDSAQLFELYQWAQSLVCDSPASADQSRREEGEWEAIPRIRRIAQCLLARPSTVAYLRKHLNAKNNFMSKAEWLVSSHELRNADIRSAALTQMWDWNFSSTERNA